MTRSPVLRQFENKAFGVGAGTATAGVLENIGAISRAVLSSDMASATRIMSRIGGMGIAAALTFHAGLQLAKNACAEKCSP